METLYEEFEPEEDTPETPEVDKTSSFEAVGQSLHAQREVLQLSLEEVAQHTHLRIPYLKALEAGDIDALPSPVQGRGMLKNYAGFLGLNSDQLLLRFADGLQTRLAEKMATEETPSSRPHSKRPRRDRRFLSRDLIIGIILALALVVFIIWGTIQVTAIRSDKSIEPTAPSIADVLLPSSTPTPVPTPTPTLLSPVDENNGAIVVVEQPVIEETQAVFYISENIDGAVQVQIVARQRAWMRITVDGDVEYDGRIIPGTIYGFSGEEYVEITTGNGAGLQVFYNDNDLGTLGTLGEVITFVITITGVQTPTPTITLIPTETRTPEGTPTPTS